jgi:hypothetical protein
MPAGKRGGDRQFGAVFVVQNVLWHHIDQRTHRIVELRILDETGALLAAQRSAEHTRQTEHRQTAAGHAARRVVLADQFALRTEHRHP